MSGNTIGSITVVDGTDTGNSVNDVVEMIPTAAWAQDLSDALTNQHSRTGTHTVITATSLSTTGNSTIGGNETVAGTLGITGAATLASLVLNGSLTGTGLGTQVTTYTNPGSAGGTNSFFYVNLGGIKLLWGKTAVQASSAAGGSWAITPPAAFFTTINTVVAMASDMTVDARQYIANNSTSTSSVAFTFICPAGNASTAASVFMIGT